MHVVVDNEMRNRIERVRVRGINVEAKESTNPTHKRSKQATTESGTLRVMLQFSIYCIHEVEEIDTMAAFESVQGFATSQSLKSISDGHSIAFLT